MVQQHPVRMCKRAQMYVWGLTNRQPRHEWSVTFSKFYLVPLHYVDRYVQLCCED